MERGESVKIKVKTNEKKKSRKPVLSEEDISEEDEDQEQSYEQPPVKKKVKTKVKVPQMEMDDTMEFEGKRIYKKDLKKVLKRQKILAKQKNQNMNKYLEDDTLDEQLLKDSELSIYSQSGKMP